MSVAASPVDAAQDGVSLRRRGVCGRVRDVLRVRGERPVAGWLAVVVAVTLLIMPSPYVVQMPGPTRNVLGSDAGAPVLDISGAATYEDHGELLLVTVNASGVPGYPVSNAQSLWGWADPHMEVIPQEAVFPVGQSAEEYGRESQGQMDGSQDAAEKIALEYARGLGVDVSDVKVDTNLDDIGGPSAGMMMALGIIDKLTDSPETQGRVIAGTGTIDGRGEVGPIGGIRLKMLGARRDGATWFLAPASNCDEVVGHVPQGMTDVKVSTLDEAYKALVAIGDGLAGDLPRCTA